MLLIAAGWMRQPRAVSACIRQRQGHLPERLAVEDPDRIVVPSTTGCSAKGKEFAGAATGQVNVADGTFSGLTNA